MAASTSYIIDVSEWLLGGAGVLDSDLKLSDSRLTGARAFPSLQVHCVGWLRTPAGDDAPLAALCGADARGGATPP